MTLRIFPHLEADEMMHDPETSAERKTFFGKYLAISSVVLLLAAGYVGWIFYSRWKDNRALEEKAAAQRRAQDARTFEGMGGNRFEILGLYANPASIHAGDTADICYSVSNAKTVKLEPQTHEVWPAFSHCVQVSPRKTTVYTFTAEDGAGHTKTEQVTVEVR
jgi:hypothetical protein